MALLFGVLIALVTLTSSGATALTPAALGPCRPEAAQEIVANDNRVAAGRLSGSVLSLDLRAAVGTWRPEGASGRALQIEALGELEASLSVPAPLLRVREGTVVKVSLRNDLSHPIKVFGFCQRGGKACAPIEVGPGETGETRFESGPAGTYTYWATTTGMPQQFRASLDTQLSGAFVVDPREGAPEHDRVLVITEWTSLSVAQLRALANEADPGAAFLKLRPEAFFAINGLIWPHTERLRYQLSDTVRWKVINLSTQVHPMHLHGFYFEVDSLGDGVSDRPFPEDQKSRVVTQVMSAGTTMSMTWKPEREGNWLFHCHVMTHVSPLLHVDGTPRDHAAHTHDAGAGMTGMVLGVTVDAADQEESWPQETRPARRLTLVMQEEPRQFGDAPALAFALAAPGNPGRPRLPGPTLVLTRDEPVEITLVNRLGESTAIHWHGMELESYYDGVHGWGRTGQRITPMIEPGASFVVRFTPPRSGTFIYHTHLHDHRQLTSGLYGAMLVVEPDEALDEALDHVLVLGRGGPHRDAPLVINNTREPELTWSAGAAHRVRLINITPDDIVVVSLREAGGPADWTPLTKDGAPVPPVRRTAVRAEQVIAVGETYDFEYIAPPGRRTLWLEVRTPGGRWLLQGKVWVR